MNDDNHTSDDEVEARLRRTLQAVAAATPVEDRRAALLSAIDEAEPPTLSEEDVMHLDARTDPARPMWRRPMFLAAAAALVVVAIVGAVLAGDDDAAVELPPAEDGQVPATGWYVPPEGWEITEIRTDFLDLEESGSCPCDVMVAAGPGAEAPAVVVHESAGPVDVAEGAPIDVGGRQGVAADVGVPVLQVGSGDHNLLLMSSDVEQAAVVALADAWLDQREAGQAIDTATLPLPEGMTAGDIVPVVGRDSVHVLDVTAVEAATGRRTYYQLVPAGAYYTSLVIDAGSVTPRDGLFEIASTVGVTPLVGLLGGPTDLVVGPSFFAGEGDLVDTDELRSFLRGLRQVSVAEWRDAIADAEVDPEVTAAESLFGPPLVDGPVDG